MASLFDKLDLLFSATLNQLVDEALQANSVAVLDEHIRRAGNTHDQLEETMVNVQVDIGVQQRKMDGLEIEVARLSERAMGHLRAGREDLAAIDVKDKQAKEQAQQKAESRIAALNAELDKFRKADATLLMRITDLKTARENVEQALEIARQKQQTVKTLRDLSNVLDNSSAAGILEWAAKVEAKADLQLQAELDDTSIGFDPLADQAVADELAQMQAELNGDQASRLSVPPPTQTAQS